VQGYHSKGFSNMKLLKKIFLVIFILISTGILFRGCLFRYLVTYQSIGQRNQYTATSADLIESIENQVGAKPNLAAMEIIQRSLDLTTRRLRFTATRNAIDPNILIHSKTAHCVGYAAFFATTCNYLFEKHHMANEWKATPHIGQLYFWGENLHRHFHTPFFKDHDFVLLENKLTGQVIAVDPTVSDYLWIDRVTYE